VTRSTASTSSAAHYREAHDDGRLEDWRHSIWQRLTAHVNSVVDDKLKEVVNQLTETRQTISDFFGSIMPSQRQVTVNTMSTPVKPQVDMYKTTSTPTKPCIKSVVIQPPLTPAAAIGGDVIEQEGSGGSDVTDSASRRSRNEENRRERHTGRGISHDRSTTGSDRSGNTSTKHRHDLTLDSNDDDEVGREGHRRKLSNRHHKRYDVEPKSRYSRERSESRANRRYGPTSDSESDEDEYYGRKRHRHLLRDNLDITPNKRRRDRSTTDSDRQEKERYRRKFHRKPHGYSVDAPVGRRGDLTSDTDDQVESTRRERMSSKRHQRRDVESKSRHSRDRSVELSPRRHRNKSDEDSDCEVKSRRSSHHHSHKRTEIKLPTYDGSTSVDAFLSKFRTAADYNDWNRRDKAAHLRSLLVGPAEMLQWSESNPSYREIVNRLQRRFGASEQEEKFRIELKLRRRRNGESLQELAADIERMIILAYPGTDVATRDILSRDSFVDALDCRPLEIKVKESQPASMQAALTTALRFEMLHRSLELKREAQIPKLKNVRSVEAVNAEEVVVKPFNRNNKKNGVKKPIPAASGRNDAENLDARVSRLVEQRLKQFNLSSTTEARQSSQKGQSQTSPVFSVDAATSGPNCVSPMSIPSPWYNQPVVQQQPSPQLMSPYTPTYGTGTMNCYACGQPGHFRRNCPNRQAMDYHQSGRMSAPLNGQLSAPTSQARASVHKKDGDARVYLRLKLGGKRELCLLDTGTDITLIPSRFVGKHQLVKTSEGCLAANGTRIPIKGYTSIQASIGDIPVAVNGLVSEHVHEVMLGYDWMRDNRVMWNFIDGEIVVLGQTFKLQSGGSDVQWCRRAVLTDDVLVPPKSQMDVTARTVFNCVNTTSDSPPEVWSTRPSEVKDGVLVARTLLPDRTSELPIRILNTTDIPVKVCRHTVLSNLEPVEPVSMTTEPLSATPADDDVIEEMVTRVDPTTSEPIVQQLRQLLHRYSSVFSKNDLDLGWTDLAEHRIDTGDKQPFRQPLRRYPQVHQQAIDKHLSDMLQQRVIEPAASEWASNIVLVKKKDGSLRCCVDYRQLNELTKKDAYPVPRQDDCIDSLSGSSWFTTVDLRCGYHQCSVRSEDTDKTAFVTRRGTFKFRTMPFGLCNAVATFQRLMDMVMAGLNFDICLIYLDDVVVHSKTPEEHLRRLEQVLIRFQQANLKLKPSKCWLMQTQVTFLGHIISKDGVATDPEKTRLVQQWPVPTNLKQLRGFLGLTGYYRKFVEGYAKIASPLHELMKKSRQYIWTEQCQLAFERLKAALLSPPVLALPQDDDEYTLDTDACETSIGAVLSVVRDGRERVIAYAGRALSKNEQNYCVTRKELLAIVFFVKYFRQYLLGKQFKIRTDHAPLAWLKKMPDPVGQNARWLELLGEYSFQVEHRKGKSHANADSLSRHPCLNRPSCTACHPVETDTRANAVTLVTEPSSFTPEQGLAATRGATDYGSQSIAAAGGNSDGSVSEIEDENHQIHSSQAHVSQPTEPAENVEDIGWTKPELAAAQQQDPELKFVMRLLSEHTTRPQWKVVELQSADVKSLWYEWERLVVKDNVLYRKWTSIYGTSDRLQIVLPHQYRPEFIRLVHTGMTGGHLGRTKTEEQVRTRAYWPNWRSQVAAELKRCQQCASYHRGKPPKQTLLQPFCAGEPFEVIAVDITGPHPKSSRGNEYIVTVIDLFTKWAEAYPVRNHTAPVVAKVLMDNIISRHGCPKRCLSDRGVEFESGLFQEFCSKMGIEKIRTTAYQPSTNACVERFHRTLNSMLAKVIKTNQRDWDDCLPTVMAAYRAAKHSSTGFSPNALVFGRENRAPIDIVLGSIAAESEAYESYDDYVCAMQRRQRDLYALAREHLETAAERRKDDYDIKVKPRAFTVGQWVWYLYPRRYVKKSPKWTRNYDGPFLVVKVIEPADYVIQKSRKSQPQVVHQNKLKPCYCPTPANWLEEVRGSTEEPLRNGPPTSLAVQGTAGEVATTSRKRHPDIGTIYDGYENVPEVERTKRSRKSPAWFADYDM